VQSVNCPHHRRGRVAPGHSRKAIAARGTFDCCHRRLSISPVLPGLHGGCKVTAGGDSSGQGRARECQVGTSAGPRARSGFEQWLLSQPVVALERSQPCT
jgi:hypothetical protein